MDSLIGKKVEGRYEVTELIGIGGMANVYKAMDVVDHKTVAIKLLREEFYSNEEFLRRFKNESKAIALLSHKNIVQVYDVCFSRGMQMIVMEYLDGITLKEYMEQQGALSWKETVNFTRQILEALTHAHARGIIHRDMKPQNVMLLPDGTVKLADFGIARFARSESRTLTDRAIGSVHYISPEQARGEHTDQRADIYSVGVMMFEMLTGELPFDADSPVSVALKQIQSATPSIRGINASVPEGLESITARAMEKDADCRYDTATAMLKDIEEFRGNPTASFEYQYLTDEQNEGAKYRKAIKRAKDSVGQKREPPSKGDAELMPRRTSNHKDDDREDSGSVLMVLAGITAAFVVVSITFIFTMLYLNNPLEKVPDAKVPDLLGLSYEDVRDASEYKKFDIVMEEARFNALYPKGAIVDQSPKSGKIVKEKSIIKVVVSSGQEVVVVPNVVGLEETAAYQELAKADLEYQKVEIFATVPPGMVVSTEPGADSQVAAGSIVKVNISMGQESMVVSVPNLVGMKLADAKKAITDAGLMVGGISYVISDKPIEEVIAQDPAHTSQVSRGGFININVSSGPEQGNKITLNIPLPTDVTTAVKLTARYTDKTLKEDMVIPSIAKNWRPSFEGTGTVTIHVLYNDFLFMTTQIDFDTGSWSIVEDNSAAHN